MAASVSALVSKARHQWLDPSEVFELLTQPHAHQLVLQPQPVKHPQSTWVPLVWVSCSAIWRVDLFPVASFSVGIPVCRRLLVFV